uniref:Uncharacterized protein n=1 Tax=Candidatus Kentrum sp. UNK TaxID=2126344 RepID=A0A451B5D8_9GAMM|nr:MAG: hypothetical protein BECKUNK1418G_GA0071005_12195 [Candidatus Kentron sp. UNK]VFK73504.1 MAG: hypothetical protein BECKUNK1418H_GA0071006_12115 [Candidatus Kentron sp. UNK]
MPPFGKNPGNFFFNQNVFSNLARLCLGPLIHESGIFTFRFGSQIQIQRSRYPVIPAWIRHSRGGGNGIQRHGWYLNSKEILKYLPRNG